jgi:hypothetical protein
LSHNFSFKGFTGIVTYLHSQDELDKTEELISCETTMLPYISKIYETELEDHLETCGYIRDIGLGSEVSVI